MDRTNHYNSTFDNEDLDYEYADSFSCTSVSSISVASVETNIEDDHFNNRGRNCNKLFILDNQAELKGWRIRAWDSIFQSDDDQDPFGRDQIFLTPDKVSTDLLKNRTTRECELEAVQEEIGDKDIVIEDSNEVSEVISNNNEAVQEDIGDAVIDSEDHEVIITDQNEEIGFRNIQVNFPNDFANVNHDLGRIKNRGGYMQETQHRTSNISYPAWDVDVSSEAGFSQMPPPPPPLQPRPPPPLQPRPPPPPNCFSRRISRRTPTNNYTVRGRAQNRYSIGRQHSRPLLPLVPPPYRIRGSFVPSHFRPKRYQQMRRRF